jgi:hypothetical protein
MGVLHNFTSTLDQVVSGRVCCLLGFSQWEPINLLFRKIGIFVTLQPKAKPVHVSLLRLEQISRHGHNMCGIVEHDHINRFVKCSESAIRFPVV